MKTLLFFILLSNQLFAQILPISSGTGSSGRIEIVGRKKHKPEIQSIIDILEKRGVDNGDGEGIWSRYDDLVRYMPLRSHKIEYYQCYFTRNDSIVTVAKYRMHNDEKGMGYEIISEKQFYPPLKK